MKIQGLISFNNTTAWRDLIRSEVIIAKRKPFKKVKPGEPIPVTARQLENFMLEHKGKFNSRDYDKFERMKLAESPVHDAVHELKTYSLETLVQRFDARLLGRGKRIFARLDSKDDTWHHFSLACIPRALNNRDINDAMVQMFFIGKWKVHKLSLWRNRKILCITATILTKHSTDSSIDSHQLSASGF